MWVRVVNDSRERCTISLYAIDRKSVDWNILMVNFSDPRVSTDLKPCEYAPL